MKMGGIFHFFCEDVTVIDHTGDVYNQNMTWMMAFVDHTLPKVDIFDAFGGTGGGPIYRCLVIIVYRCAGIIRKGT